MKKKMLSLALALALCLGLCAVPAAAAGYGPYKLTFTDPNENTCNINFSSAKVEKRSFTDFESEKYVENADVVVIQPGCTVKVTDAQGKDTSVEYYVYVPYTDDSGKNGYIGGGTVGYLSADHSPVTTLSKDYENALGLIWIKTGAIYLAMGDGTAPSAPAASTTPAQSAESAKPSTSTAPAAPAVPAGPGSYTVKVGDTLGMISVNYYGSYAYSNAIYKANAAAFKKTGGKLNAGMTLNLPDTIGKVARMAPATAGTGETLYTVKAGDTLGTIAKAAYGNPAQYKAIFERNADRLKNANTIYEGQVIVLPAK